MSETTQVTQRNKDAFARAQSDKARRRAKLTPAVDIFGDADGVPLWVRFWSEVEGKENEVSLRVPIFHRSAVEHAGPTSHVIPPACVLLVDDSADAAEALSMLRGLDGHEVKRAYLVESFAPDATLIDIHMPGMNGYELARLLRQRSPCAATRLVALTGYIDNGAHDSSAVFDCYLVKPPSLEDLAEALKTEAKLPSADAADSEAQLNGP